MDGEVVDGLVAFREVAVVGCCREHFVDGAGVGEGEGFVLGQLVSLALLLKLQIEVKSSRTGIAIRSYGCTHSG